MAGKIRLCKVVSWGNHFGRIGNYKLLGEANKNECGDKIEDFEKLINSWFKGTENAIQGF